MPKLTNTYALAYACCDTILTELGRFPTIDLIRSRIGVNSPNTIKQAMNDWTATFAKQHVERQRGACPEVPSILNEVLQKLWQSTLKEAEKQSAEQVIALQATVATLEECIEQHKTALEKSTLSIKEATLNLAAKDTQINGLTQHNAELKQALIDAQQREQKLIAALAAQAQQEATLKAQHAQRLSQEQAWMQRRILEERELVTNKSSVALKAVAGS